MHEYSIVASVIAQVDEHAAKHEGALVTAVELRVGEWAGVDVALLETAWTLFREDTSCAEAALRIHVEPVRFTCRRCDAGIETGERLRCPCCGGPATLSAGDALVLERIELEVEDDV